MSSIKTGALAFSLLALILAAACQTTGQPPGSQPLDSFERPVPAATQFPRTPTPEDGKAATSLGLEAAKEKDWKAAIKHFTEALKFDITTSPVLFNLAYAHDRMGLDEFQAIAFYRAYLASAPNSKKAGPIGKRIAELETRIKAKAMKLLALAERTASALPSGTMDRELSFMDVAITHAAIGDFEAAFSGAASLKSYYDSAIVGIAKFQAEYGDITGARKTIGKLKDTGESVEFFAHLAKVQAEAGSPERLTHAGG